MRVSRKTAIILLAALMMVIPSLAVCSCNGDDDDGTGGGGVTTTPTGEREDVTITIGNLTDKTSVSSNAMAIIDTALKDMVEYYNQENLIPGVKLKTIEYDEQYDPSRDIPGYEWLREKGADFIWTPVPAAVPTLMSRMNQDEFVLFTATANMKKSELERGYVFSLGITPMNEAFTMLSWLPDNDPDFPEGRPAKIGGAAWSEAYSNIWFSSIKEYCEAHPDQYDWVDGFLTDFSFIWDTEVEALKDCDYVYVPSPPQIFMRDYRDAGYEATFLGTDIHTAFLGMITKTGIWDEIDGSYFIRSSRWYNETGPIIDLINQLLENKHSASEAETFKAEGCGYLGAKQIYLMLDIVRQAVENVGPENFDTQALYDAATSWKYEYEGIDDFNSFNEAKRVSQNYYAIYEAVAADKDLQRVSQWLPQVSEPAETPQPPTTAPTTEPPPTTTAPPTETPEPTVTPECTTYYWFDNTTDVCGQLGCLRGTPPWYEGLQVFDTLEECQDALAAR